VKRCFQIHPADNVATLLDDANREPLVVLGQPVQTIVEADEKISLGHKVALKPIAVDAPIIKFGAKIAIATATIKPGSWVHLHNCRSQLDERSNRLDIHSGVDKDTAYE
jgi:hypothetical protein